MLPPVATDVIVDQKILDAIAALGQLTTERLVIVGIIIALLVLGFYLRLRFKAEEAELRRNTEDAKNEAKRIEENGKIFTTFGEFVDRAEKSREKAQDDRNDKTALAIEKFTEAMVSANAYRVEQTHELRGLRTDINNYDARIVGGMEGVNTNILTLINAFGRQEDMLMRLLKFVENNPIEHAAVKEALEMNTALLNKLVTLMTPPTPETNDNGGGMNTAA